MQKHSLALFPPFSSRKSYCYSSKPASLIRIPSEMSHRTLKINQDLLASVNSGYASIPHSE